MNDDDERLDKNGGMNLEKARVWTCGKVVSGDERRCTINTPSSLPEVVEDVDGQLDRWQ